MIEAALRSQQMRHESALLLAKTVAIVALGAAGIALGAFVGGPLGVAIIVGDIALLILGILAVGQYE